MLTTDKNHETNNNGNGVEAGDGPETTEEHVGGRRLRGRVREPP